MATTIASLTQKTDGTFEGVFATIRVNAPIATIRVNAPIAIVPNANKASEEAPDYRILHRKTGFEIGAGWNRISRQTGEEYLSVKLEAPEIGVIFGNLGIDALTVEMKRIERHKPKNRPFCEIRPTTVLNR